MLPIVPEPKTAVGPIGCADRVLELVNRWGDRLVIIMAHAWSNLSERLGGSYLAALLSSRASG